MARPNFNAKRRMARELGMLNARGAAREEVESFLAGHEDGAGSKTSGRRAVAKAKSKTTPAPARAKAKTTRRSTTKATSGNRASTRRAPAASAPRSGSRQTRTQTASDGEAGRLTLGRISFTKYDRELWQPRDGSAAATIFASLKSNKGDVDEVFKALWPERKTLISMTAPNGQRRDKEDQERLLRYRINRVKWDFATKTNQHERATARVQYGSGDYAKGNRKGSRSQQATRKASQGRRNAAAAKPKAKAQSKPRGRPAGSQGRSRTSTKRK